MKQAIDLLLIERDKIEKAILILRGPYIEMSALDVVGLEENHSIPVSIGELDELGRRLAKIGDNVKKDAKHKRRQWTPEQKAAQSAAQKMRWAKLRKSAKKAA